MNSTRPAPAPSVAPVSLETQALSLYAVIETRKHPTLKPQLVPIEFLTVVYLCRPTHRF